MTTTASIAVPLTHLTELATSEACLTADLAGRDADWAESPSHLPGWSRGHIVAHLAGNAYGLVNLCDWAESGVETPMYPSPEARASEIDRRAALPWPDLAAESDVSATVLRERLATLREPLSARCLRLGSGAPMAATDLAAVRIREVEIHRVDLGAEYQPVDWSAPFTVRTLGQLVPFFLEHRDVPVQVLRSVDSGHCWQVGETGPDLLGTEADLMAWLLGRHHGPLRSTDQNPIPAAPAWV